MKRIIIAILAIVLTTCFHSSPISYAVEQSELQKFASSLGADTDFLNIPNFAHGDENGRPIPDGIYSEFISKCTNYEASIWSEDKFEEALSNGACYGISLLEILSHNGIIKPSDIKPDAGTLSEISYSTDVDRFIVGYHASQLHYENDYYLTYKALLFNSKTQCDELIKTTEKNMAENKYFMICYYGSQAHAVVGIGITDGNWQYKNMDFDKCILTFDSNCFDDYDHAAPFKEYSCIYINSETYDYYIPKYNYGSLSGTERIHIIASDNTDILNNKGIFSPSEKMDFDFSDKAEIHLSKAKYKKYDVTVKDENGSVIEVSKDGNKLALPEDVEYYLPASEFHIETDNKLVLGEADNDNFHIATQRYFFEAETEKGHGIFDVNDTEHDAASKNGKEMVYKLTIKYNEGYYPCTPHFNWTFNGKTVRNFKSEITDNGMLLSSDNIIETVISTTDVKLNEDGTIADVNYNPNEVKITAVNDVLVSFDNLEKICFFIDPDNDGKFDTAIEKGDVNSDGVIDGRDATSVLTDYAKISADKNSVSYLNDYFADFNDDGVIDGRDATNILTLYAEMSIKY